MVRNYQILHPEARAGLDLCGEWEVIVDPCDAGWLTPFCQVFEGRHNIGADATPESPSDLVEYCFSPCHTLRVPGDWNTQREDLFWMEGSVWYRRHFDCEPQAGRRYFVYFAAANYEANAFLNGEPVGSHEGGFTPFQFEVTDCLCSGRNSLVVRVNNERRHDGVPNRIQDWFNYGGLTREVRLLDLPPTYVAEYHLQLAPGSQSRLSGWVQLEGREYPESLTVRIAEMGLEKQVSVGPDGRAVMEWDLAGLELWSPENPKLYDVVIETDSDRVSERIGFRSIEVRGTEILLNGQPLYLRGISMHEEAPYQGGRAHSKEHAATLLGWAQELGCNFVRFAHYPYGEQFTRLADEMGLLAWCELPVYWNIQFENPHTLRRIREMQEEMVAHHRNRASVIVWSLGNETQKAPGRLQYFLDAAKHARSLDATRLISAALFVTQDDVTLRVDDEIGQCLDLLAINQYQGWYRDTKADFSKYRWESKYDKPLVISETGGGAVYGRRGDEWERWTEEFQARIYREQIAMIERIPFCRGLSPWILKDFRTPRRLLYGMQDYWNRKGVLDDNGNRKLAFGVLQDFYARKKKACGEAR